MAKKQDIGVRGSGWWIVIGALVVGALGAFYYAKGLVETSG